MDLRWCTFGWKRIFLSTLPKRKVYDFLFERVNVCRLQPNIVHAIRPVWLITHSVDAVCERHIFSMLVCVCVFGVCIHRSMFQARTHNSINQQERRRNPYIQWQKCERKNTRGYYPRLELKRLEFLHSCVTRTKD